jgi:hypothetical protein
MLFKEAITVYSGNHMKKTKTLCGQTSELIVKVDSSLHSYQLPLGFERLPGIA